MKQNETKMERAIKDRNEVAERIVIAEKSASLLALSGANVFIELLNEWVKYFENRLNSLDPLDEHLQLSYIGNRTANDFLKARLWGLQNADKELLRLQGVLLQAELELKKQVKAAKQAEQNAF